MQSGSLGSLRLPVRSVQLAKHIEEDVHCADQLQELTSSVSLRALTEFSIQTFQTMRIPLSGQLRSLREQLTVVNNAPAPIATAFLSLAPPT